MRPILYSEPRYSSGAYTARRRRAGDLLRLLRRDLPRLLPQAVTSFHFHTPPVYLYGAAQMRCYTGARVN
jgi:hypothetical protein